MPHPRQKMPFFLQNLQYNARLKKYEITDQLITFQMDLEHTRMLKVYYRNQIGKPKFSSLEDWYKAMPREVRKEIKRISRSG